MIRIVPLTEITGEQGLPPNDYKFIALRDHVLGEMFVISALVLSDLPLTDLDLEKSSDTEDIRALFKLRAERHEEVAHRHMVNAMRFNPRECFGGFITLSADGTITVKTDTISLSVSNDHVNVDNIQEAFNAALAVSTEFGVCIIEADLLRSIKETEQFRPPL